MKPSTRRVLKALQAAGGRGATTHELGQPDVGGFRFSARLYELRQEGYQITEKRERRSSSRYTLVDPPELERFRGEAHVREGVGSTPEDFAVGERVRYEVATQTGEGFVITATVVGHTKRRVLVEFTHWRSGEVVRRAARPNKLRRLA